MIEIQRLPFWPAMRLPYRLGRTAMSLIADRALGVDTTLVASELSLSGGRHDDYIHGPVGWTRLWRIFRHLEVAPQDVLYDVGCGSGRPLLVAGRLPFARRVGIELSTRIHAMAERNVRRTRLSSASPLEIINGDALTHPIPKGTSIVFFANPFDGEVFERFIAHLLADLDQHPRALRFVYHNPREHRMLETTGRFHLTQRFIGLRPGKEWARSMTTHIYDVLPAAAGER